MYQQCHVTAACSMIWACYIAYVLSKLNLKPDSHVNNIHNSVSTSQKTRRFQYKCHLLMFRGVPAVCSVGHMERPSCEQCVDISNETPTWCNTVQVLFLQGHSTCFGRKRPSSRVFKTSTAATGTCVIAVGQSSHFLIRAGGPNKQLWWLLMQHCAGFISAGSLYMFRAQAPIIRSI